LAENTIVVRALQLPDQRRRQNTPRANQCARTGTG
jgi:hypothetical protein